MKPVFQSIYTKYNGDTTGLKLLLTNGLHLGRVPQGSTFPYGTYSMVSNVTDEGFKFVIDDMLIQFDFFSRNASASSVCDVFTAAKNLYDWCTLSTTGSTQYSHILMKREFSHLLTEDAGDYKVWHYISQYHINWQST